MSPVELIHGLEPTERGVTSPPREVSHVALAGSERGAQSAAIIFSLLGSCALCGIDPVEYLATVMPILGRGVIEKDVIDLLPRKFPL